MNLSKQIQKIGARTVLFFRKHGTTMLAIGACVGVGATGYLAARAGAKAEMSAYVASWKKSEASQKNEPSELTAVEYVKATYRDYIPPVAVGAVTIGCIISAHVLDKKRAASLIAAYTVLDQSYRQYRRKIQEKYGEEADKEVRTEIVKAACEEEKPETPSEPKLLIYDYWGKRYLELTESEVRYAEYHFNRNFILRGYATLNEFYEFLGAAAVEDGNVVGWSFEAGTIYGYLWVDFEHEKVETDEGLEVYILSFPFPPTADFMSCGTWD